MESSIMEEEKMEEENTENQNYPITIQTEEPIQSSIKDKISNVLHHNNFCGICLELSDELLPLTSQLQFPEQEYSMTVGDLLRQVFGNALPNMIFHGQCCQICLNQIINIYFYIETTKNNARTYNYYLTELNTELNNMQLKLSSDKHGQLTHALLILKDPNVKENTENVSLQPKLKKKKTRFTCKRCHEVFNSKLEITKHKLNHVCGKKSSTSVKYPKKKANLTIFKERECVQCHKSKCEHEIFIQAFYVQKNIKKSPLIRCPECDYSITSRTTASYFLRHVNQVHLKKPAEICEQCGKYLYGVNEYKYHLIRYHGPKSHCSYCDRYFRNDEFEKHEELCKNITREFSCQSCPASFSSYGWLQRHQIKHKDTCSGSLKCGLCNFQTTFTERLSRHVEAFHSTNPQTAKLPAGKKGHLCTICFSRVTYKTYIEHMKDHDVNVKCLCRVCLCHFETLEERKIHEKTKEHIERCRYQCEQCVYGTYHKFVFLAHVNREHKKISPYVCEYCDKSFVARINYLNHIRIHSKTYRKFECSYCDKKIGCASGLRRHIARFHEQDKLLRCPHCDRGCVTESAMKCHILTKHTRERNVACPLCSSTFYTILNLRTHIHKVHWKSKEHFDLRKVEGLTEEDFEFLRDRRRGLVEEMNDYTAVMD